MKHLVLLLLGYSFVCSTAVHGQEEPVRVGSKTFTESVILGEMAAQLLTSAGIPTEHVKQLGGSRILFNALLSGDLGVYPEYTGTLIGELLADSSIAGFEQLEATLNKMGIGITQPLGFNNTYALGMNKAEAEQLSMISVSDIRKHPGLKLGFSNEFLDRQDGWKGLQHRYQIQEADVTGLDHDLAYRALEAGDIQVIDLYSTDAEIEYYQLTVLDDDLGFFPSYEAVYLYRLDLTTEYPVLLNQLNQLEGRINEMQMIRLNARVKLDRESDASVVASFLNEEFGVISNLEENGFWSRLWVHTWDHIQLVGISLALAIVLAIPLGICAVKLTWLEQPILSVTGILQTVPSLALLVFMIPVFGIGALPAMAALFVYSLLPIVRNTHAGIQSIPQELIESARALGLPSGAILRKIEFPLALPTILAGIKTAAVINVGTATLGALIGAGGYGQPILTGIRLDDTALILEGAIPAAILALLVQWSFDALERFTSVSSTH
ncbi:MAG: glycine betaine ABC transporter substrate-binding protein [Bacteroidota bacterium]